MSGKFCKFLIQNRICYSLFLSLSLCFIYSCDGEIIFQQDALTDGSVLHVNQETKRNSFCISEADAIAIADSIMDNLFPDNGTRAYSKKIKECKRLEQNRNTRSLSDSIEYYFYIVNYENDGGFALIAGDRRTTPVYAFSDHGTLEFPLSDNNPISFFLEAAFDYYKNDIDNYIPNNNASLHAFVPMPDGFDMIAEKDGEMYYFKTVNYQRSYEDLISTEWDQCSPYNYYYPSATYYSSVDGNNYDYKYAAGCVPVAVSQIMRFHSYPAYFRDGTIIWWNLMQDSYPIGDYSSSALNTAYLIYQVLQSMNASYSSTDTSINASVHDAEDAFHSFGYTYIKSNFNRVNVTNSVDNHRPVFASGKKVSGGGHAWVIDGYRQTYVRNLYYYMEPPYNLFAEEHTNETWYYHCNWGWGTFYQNGYFLDVFNSPEETYDQDRKILYNIHPNNN